MTSGSVVLPFRNPKQAPQTLPPTARAPIRGSKPALVGPVRELRSRQNLLLFWTQRLLLQSIRATKTPFFVAQDHPKQARTNARLHLTPAKVKQTKSTHPTRAVGGNSLGPLQIEDSFHSKRALQFGIHQSRSSPITGSIR